MRVLLGLELLHLTGKRLEKAAGYRPLGMYGELLGLNGVLLLR